MRRQGSGDRSTFPAAAFGAVALVVLAVAAFFLAGTQAEQREDLRERYADRTVVATALVDSLFDVAFNGTRTTAAERFRGERISAAEVDALVRRGNARWIAILEASGDVVAASSDTPPEALARLRTRPPHFGEALGSKGFGLGDAAGETIEAAVGFRGAGRQRVQVTGSPLETFRAFLSGTLAPLPGNPEARAYVIDGQGALLASVQPDAKSPTPTRPLLDAVARGETTGTFERDDTERFFAASRIPGSRWRLAVSVSADVLYASASGVSRLLPWIILGVAALASVGIALLMRRLYRTAGALRRANAELASSNAELARSNSDLEQFAYVASHDLSEPLRTVAGFSQLLGNRYRGRLDPEADLYISHMGEGVDRMQQLIDDLLLYSRVGRAPVRGEAVDLDELLGEVLQSIEPVMRERGAQITSDDLPVVVGEPGQLRQVLQNLIVNALKFTAPGVQPRVHVGAERDGRGWRISARDNGIGVAPEQREAIFKMFGRLHPADAYPGTGIGLALAKRIIERHGGTIWMEEPGRDALPGSVFVFTIPDRAPVVQPPAREPEEVAT